MSIVALAFELLIALIALEAYFRIASVRGPYALPTDRSLHQGVIPRGGGIAIAAAVLVVAAILAALQMLPGAIVLPLFVGGTFAALSGMADDRLDIRPRYRLLMQAVAASTALFGAAGVAWLGIESDVLRVAAVALLLFGLIWFYNLFNFVDGSDGMAGTGALFVSTIMGLIFLIGGEVGLVLILGLVAVATAAFLFYNLPPARMFLGDAGTFFLAYLFSVAMIFSVSTGAATVWTWFAAFSFYIADTTTTTTTRALTVGRGIYKRHRSHAYQNLARHWGHKRILQVVLAINVVWVGPWTLATVYDPVRAPIYTLIVYVPLVLFSLRFGPRFQDS
jgi:Fuc2NAc and GlcNAc transferase